MSGSKGGPDKVLDFRTFGERPAKGLATSLYIGSKIDAKAEKELRERGVKFILNCTPTRNLDPEAGCPNFFEGRTPPPFTYKRIALFDNRGEDILQYMEGAIAFIDQSKHYGSVLVHCNKGVSRSASFVIGYLMKAGGMRLDAALAMLKEKRSIVQPNDSFMAQLRTYDARLETQRAEARARQERLYGSSSSSSTTAPSAPATKAATNKPSAIGPALPPHLQQAQKAKADAAAAIGPALPPHPQKAKAQEKEGAAAEDDGGGQSSSGPQAPAKPKAIGPALPPHLQPQNKPAAAGATIGPSPPPPPAPAGEGGDKKRPAVIGPAMPPPAAKGDGEEDGGEREGKRART